MRTNTVVRRTPMGACASCGAYDNTPCRPACTPGKKFQLGPSQWARPDVPFSPAFLRRLRMERERRLYL